LSTKNLVCNEKIIEATNLNLVWNEKIIVVTNLNT